MTDKEKDQQKQGKAEAAVSFGATLLGAFLGRKALQAATIGQLTTDNQTESQFPMPCPFCGMAELKIKNQTGPYTFYFVECPECQARGPVATSEEKAKAGWSRRVDFR